MGIANTTNWASGTVLQPVFQPGFVEAVYRNGDLSRILPVRNYTGDTAARWKVQSAGNTAAVHTEGSSLAAAGAQTYVNAAVSFVTLEVVFKITGEARNALMGKGSYEGFDAVEAEFQSSLADLHDIMNTNFLGSTYGLELAIDSSSNYAGITRGSATYWQSYEDAVTGALAHSDLMDMREAIEDNDRGGNLGLILCPHNQKTNIQSLVGAPGATSNSYRHDPTASNGKLQLAATEVWFGNAPVIGVGDMTNTVILGLDMGPKSDPHIAVSVPFEMRQADSGYDDVYAMFTSSALVVKSPILNGKLTGVTA